MIENNEMDEIIVQLFLFSIINYHYFRCFDCNFRVDKKFDILIGAKEAPVGKE
jgi:hypothetical protein